ncbi:TIGR01777 family oxidoreductase [Acaricomes phytoseiuli]|uniref:TIGR01777 family oxidoreductase n=1 Tax=Acaricomes phytoseiuli TaxID=291968 RepID=UPI0003754642|nr:TIGR01777 family oxidoreductase [Acaricomes phytoseiuli]
MRILISGASGMLGTAIAKLARSHGHDVISLVRRDSHSPQEISWDPSSGSLDPVALEGVDAVINLSGSPILEPPRRWTKNFIENLYDSRLGPTRTLVKAMHQAANPPRVFLSQSGKDYYGQGGPYTESSPAAEYVQQPGVLNDLCLHWEEAAEAAPEQTRTITMRTGVVFGPQGGALAKLLTPLRLGLGGNLGSGEQHWPWIALPDLAAAALFLLDPGSEGAEVRGPVNFCAPEAATVQQIVKALGTALNRPTFFTVPAFALRAGLGKAADEVLLADTVTVPAVLSEAGFDFRYPTVTAAADWIAAELRS